MGRRVKQGDYTTIDASGLGKFAARLKSIVESLQSKLISQTSEEKPSPETEFTQKQLAAIIKAIELFHKIAPKFDKGKDPGALSLLTDKDIWSLDGEIDKIKMDLGSIRYIIYKSLKKNLADILQRTYENVRETKKNSSPVVAEKFKQELKAVIRQNLENFDQEVMPCKNLNIYLEEIDKLIDDYDITLYLNNGFDKNKLEKTLKELLATGFGKKDLTVGFKVVHPAFYELVVQLMMAIEEVSPSLEEFISFLNPAALSNPKLSHVKSGTSDYVYKMDDGVYNFEQLYREYRDVELALLLSSELVTYFNDYSNTPHVRNERLKMKLIQSFIELEKEQSEIKVTQCLENIENKVNGEISEERQLEECLKVFDKEITLKLQVYKNTNFGELIKLYPSLTQQLTSTDVVDSSYTNFPLPEKIILEGRQLFVLSPVQSLLAENLQAQKGNLILQYHQRKNDSIAQQLEKFTQTIPNVDLLKINDFSSLEGLEEGLAAMQQAIESLSTLHSKLNPLLEGLNPPFYCPESLKPQLYSSIVAGYKSSKEKITTVENAILKAQRLLKTQERELIGHLEKEKAAKAFQENMKSANREALLLLLAEKKKLLAEKLSEEEKIKEQLHNLEMKEQEAFVVASSDSSLEVDDPLQQEISSRASMVKALLENLTNHKETILKLTSSTPDEFDKLFTTASLESNQAGGAETWINTLISEAEKSCSQQETIILQLKSKELTLKALFAVSKLVMDGQYAGEPLAKEIDKLKELNVLKSIYAEAIETEKSKEKKILDIIKTAFKRDFGLVILAKILNVDVKNLTENLESLSGQLSTQEALVQKQITWHQTTISSNKLFNEHRSQLNNIKQATADIVLLGKSIEKHTQERKDEIKKAIATLMDALKLLKKDMTDLSAEIGILEKIEKLISGNQNLNELLNSDRKDLDNKCTEAENQFSTLIQELAELKKLIESSTNVDNYLPSITAISFLQETAGERIVKMKVARFNEEFNSIAEALESLPQSHFDSVLSLKQLLEKFNLQSESIISAFTTIGLLRNNLAKLSKKDENSCSVIPEVDSELQLTRTNLYDLLLQKTQAILEGYREELDLKTQHLKIIFDETRVNYEHHDLELKKLETYLSASRNSELSDLKVVLEKLQPASKESLNILEIVQNKIAELNKQYKSSVVVLEGQRARMVSRQELSEQFMQDLHNYETKRAEKYSFKDRFISNQDALKRKEFIKDLSEKLQQYANSGDSRSVLEYIAQERGNYSGLTLQSLLSRLVINIKVLDKKLPVAQDNYTTTEESETIYTKEQVLERLEQTEVTYPLLYKEFVNLYLKIERLERHGEKIGGQDGEVATNLAATLRGKVDRVVIQQSNKALSSGEYAAFHADFIENLHSQDDIMSKHRAFWKPFVVNMVAALLTVGVALGVHKLLTGRASFFGDTKRLQHIQELDVAVSKVADAAPAA